MFDRTMKGIYGLINFSTRCAYTGSKAMYKSAYSGKPMSWEAVMNGNDLNDKPGEDVVEENVNVEKGNISGSNNTILAMCSVCGIEFGRSKFNPYITECPKHRKKK